MGRSNETVLKIHVQFMGTYALASQGQCVTTLPTSPTRLMLACDRSESRDDETSSSPKSDRPTPAKCDGDPRRSGTRGQRGTLRANTKQADAYHG